jgi:hypothetical protein
LLGYALALAVLAYASYSDVKTREVSDLVWLIGCPAGLALSLFEASAGEVAATTLLLSAGLSACLAALLFRLGLFGGADALALLFLSLTVPAYPEGLPLLKDPLPLPFLAALCNATLLSLTWPLAVFALNLADVLRGRNPFRDVEVGFLGIVMFMFTARRVSLETLTSGFHYFPAERLVENNGRLVRTPAYFVKAEADVAAVTKQMVEHRGLYAEGVLASPTLPMIAFLAAGLALTPFGNMALQVVHLLAGMSF